MKQGVLVPSRVKLLLSKGHSCFRPRKTGERKRKSVRGCIVQADIRALALVVVKQGENDIPGLTDQVLPKRLGPKRATKIRKFFNLTKTDDVRKFVIRREVTSKTEGAKPYTKACVLASSSFVADVHAGPRSSALSPTSVYSAADTCARSRSARPSARQSSSPSTRPCSPSVWERPGPRLSPPRRRRPLTARLLKPASAVVGGRMYGEGGGDGTTVPQRAALFEPRFRETYAKKPAITSSYRCRSPALPPRLTKLPDFATPSRSSRVIALDEVSLDSCPCTR